LREKQYLFQQLAQLQRAGVSLPVSVEKLTAGSRGSVRRLLRQFQKLLKDGQSAGDALAKLYPGLGQMERSTLSALARTGRLERGFQMLSDHFSALDRVRREFISRCAYPVFVLHFGILLLALPSLFLGGGVGEYLRQVGVPLAALYGAGLALYFLIPLLIDLGSISPIVDLLLRFIPLLGKMRRNFAVASFCGTYDLQLEAGINVIESLRSATVASRSGLIRAAVKRGREDLRRGEAVGPILGAGGFAFPQEVVQSILVAEETGELHRTLPQLREEYERSALASLQAAAEWCPRLLNIGIMLYTGWRIVAWYQAYQSSLGDLQKTLDGL
jgi:type II secretory pathway component PulF